MTGAADCNCATLPSLAVRANCCSSASCACPSCGGDASASFLGTCWLLAVFGAVAWAAWPSNESNVDCTSGFDAAVVGRDEGGVVDCWRASTATCGPGKVELTTDSFGTSINISLNRVSMVDGNVFDLIHMSRTFFVFSLASALFMAIMSRKRPSRTPSIFRRKVAALPFPGLTSAVKPCLVTELLAARAKASNAYKLETLAESGSDLWVL